FVATAGVLVELAASFLLAVAGTAATAGAFCAGWLLGATTGTTAWAALAGAAACGAFATFDVLPASEFTASSEPNQKSWSFTRTTARANTKRARAITSRFRSLTGRPSGEAA